MFALDKEKLAYAGLDVFENEPNPSIHICMHNAISLTPHIGAATKEAQERIGTELADQISCSFWKIIMVNNPSFKAIRPLRDKANLVATRSYLTYSEETIKEKLDHNPYTFLHIINPDYNNKNKTGWCRQI